MGGLVLVGQLGWAYGLGWVVPDLGNSWSGCSSSHYLGLVTASAGLVDENPRWFKQRKLLISTLKYEYRDNNIKRNIDDFSIF